jgi:AP-1-like factor
MAVPNQMDGLLATDKKRGRDPSPPADPLTPLPHVCKRTRDETMVDYSRHDPFSETVSSFSSTAGCTDDSINTVDRFPPLPYIPRQNACTPGYSNISSEPDPLPPFLTCGFCDADTLCVCSEITCPSPMEQSVDSAKFNTNDEEESLVTSASSNVQDFPDATPNSRNESTSLDKLPPYEPAVPIRRRNKGIPPNSIFPIHEAPSEATCSGDPNNCLACAGDSFGQAFCAAVGNSSSKCDCSEMMSGCCGSSTRCSDCPSTIPSLKSSIPSEQMKMIPTNDAWQKIKAHPNVQFADLTLLAEVVARKSVCSGPQLVISSSSTHNSQTNHQPDGVTRQAGDSPPPRLVPHEVLLECGRKRMRQVRSDGVQEVLRLLDVKFP